MNDRDLGLLFGKSVKVAGDISSLVFVFLAQSEQLDDVTVTEHATLFPVWDENWTGTAKSIVSDEGVLYRSIHDVSSGQNTKPSATPSMWTKIGDPADEWPTWFPPIGAHDAYGIGDKVSHNNKHWTSNVSDNVWEPGVYGWTQAI